MGVPEVVEQSSNISAIQCPACGGAVELVIPASAGDQYGCRHCGARMELQGVGQFRARLYPGCPQEESYRLLGNKKDFQNGSTRTYRINGREIAVFEVNQEFFAFKNSCPHHGVELSEAKIENGFIRCPGHGYEFELKTGRCHRDPSLQASTYDLKIEGDQIFIRMK